MNIDFHTHIVSPRVKEKRDQYVKIDPCFALLYSNPKAALITAEDLIHHMDECDIGKSVILNIGWVSHEICIETNDYILESIAKYPQRLVGFCTIQPLAGDRAIKELERCIKNGIKGIGEMRPDIQGFNLADTKLLEPIVDYAIDSNLIFLIHCSEPVGHQYIGKGNITPDIVYPFILNFPKLKIVCAHWGGGLPFYALMPEVESALTNVYFDTAATYFLYKPQIFRQVIETLGNNKILFGSDYPLLSPKRIVDQIKNCYLAKNDIDEILGGNARRLLAL